MNDDYFPSPEKLLRNHQRTNGVGGSATGVSDDVRVSLFQTEETGWVNSSVHAGKNEDLPTLYSST